jgi:protein ImuB
MHKRFVAIWFRQLLTDWLTIRQPPLKNNPFVFAAPQHGRMIITASNYFAQTQGAGIGMSVADARALIPSLQVFEDKPARTENLLKAIATWFIRFTPIAAVDLPDGIILDATGCAHLWGGERAYLTDIITRLGNTGYAVRAAIADTPGGAWAIAHHGKITAIIEGGTLKEALVLLPAAALRLPPLVLLRLQKLGLNQVGSFIHMPRPALRRRFGEELLLRLDQVLGFEQEIIQPVLPVQQYQERLPCMEAITTAIGIEIALKHLLEALCRRLRDEQIGLRTVSFTGYRLDGNIQKLEIGTNHPSHNETHLFKLFEPKIETIEPDLGIELFVLEVTKTEALPAWQQKLWTSSSGLDDINLAELLDRIAGKVGAAHIHRYLPAEHYWPERCLQPATTLHEKKTAEWQTARPRPTQLLAKPEPIEVTAPVPDYPPMSFRYKNQLHTIKKADGPERIEREWWIDDGPHRDYYQVEDHDGRRYWLFRSGHYTAEYKTQWFMHGFFA